MEATDELNGPRMRACLKPIEKLIDALTGPVRRERTMLAVLAVYAVVWTLYGVIAKSSQDCAHQAGDQSGHRPKSAAPPSRGRNRAQLFGHSGHTGTLSDHRRAAAAVTLNTDSDRS